jgi:hypothetical protein
MSRTEFDRRGFSLMEVTTALGVISFALIALLGVFPLGLENSRVSVSETRASQLTRMVYSTLATEMSASPVTTSSSTPGIHCFSTTLAPLALAADGADASSLQDVTTTLYVSYLFKGQPGASDDSTGEPEISRDPSALATATYQLGLTFHPKAFTPTATAGATTPAKPRLIGYDVIMTLNGLNKARTFFQTTSFVPTFGRAAYPK